MYIYIYITVITNQHIDCIYDIDGITTHRETMLHIYYVCGIFAVEANGLCPQGKKQVLCK